MTNTHKIDVNYKTIIFTIFILGALWFLYFIRDVILQIFLALLIMSILNPFVTRLHKSKVPRAASVVIVYVAVFVALGLLIGQMVTPLIDQSTKFANSLPTYLDDLHIPGQVVEQLTVEITSQLGTLPAQLVKISVSVLSNFIAVLTVLIFALYFLLARERLDEHLLFIFKNDKSKQQRIERVIDQLEVKLGGWARGQIVIMFLVGLLNYIGLSILGVPFALPLALLAGSFEIITNIGPIIAAIPAMIVGFGISPLTGLAVAALAFLIQQIETYVFVPKVMQKSAGVNPIATLLAIVIGLKVAGIIGAILSIPVVITSQILIEEFVFFEKE